VIRLGNLLIGHLVIYYRAVVTVPYDFGPICRHAFKRQTSVDL
jgi:hypothetical protein